MTPSLRLDVALSVFHFDYREFKDDGSQFNRESGYIPGLAFTLARANNDWDVSGKFSYFRAVVGYDGMTQFGAPISTSTEETLYDISAQLGKRLLFTSANIPARIYGEIGYRQWQRDIRSTPVATGVLETYDWGYASAGATLPIRKMSWGSVAIDAKLTRTFNSSMDVNFRGLYDTASLVLGNRNGFRLALPIALSRQHDYLVDIVPYWEEWFFGRSGTENLTQYGAVVGTIFEPRSETKIAGIQIKLTKGL